MTKRWDCLVVVLVLLLSGFAVPASAAAHVVGYQEVGKDKKGMYYEEDITVTLGRFLVDGSPLDDTLAASLIASFTDNIEISAGPGELGDVTYDAASKAFRVAVDELGDINFPGESVTISWNPDFDARAFIAQLDQTDTYAPNSTIAAELPLATFTIMSYGPTEVHIKHEGEHVEYEKLSLLAGKAYAFLSELGPEGSYEQGGSTWSTDPETLPKGITFAGGSLEIPAEVPGGTKLRLIATADAAADGPDGGEFIETYVDIAVVSPDQLPMPVPTVKDNAKNKTDLLPPGDAFGEVDVAARLNLAAGANTKIYYDVSSKPFPDDPPLPKTPYNAAKGIRMEKNGPYYVNAYAVDASKVNPKLPSPVLEMHYAVAVPPKAGFKITPASKTLTGEQTVRFAVDPAVLKHIYYHDVTWVLSASAAEEVPVPVEIAEWGGGVEVTLVTKGRAGTVYVWAEVLGVKSKVTVLTIVPASGITANVPAAKGAKKHFSISNSAKDVKFSLMNVPEGTPAEWKSSKPAVIKIDKLTGEATLGSTKAQLGKAVKITATCEGKTFTKTYVLRNAPTKITAQYKDGKKWVDVSLTEPLTLKPGATRAFRIVGTEKRLPNQPAWLNWSWDSTERAVAKLNAAGKKIVAGGADGDEAVLTIATFDGVQALARVVIDAAKGLDAEPETVADITEDDVLEIAWEDEAAHMDLVEVAD